MRRLRHIFDELHQSCVKELKPCGRMEEEVVLAIAKYSHFGFH
jgi:hypothetical protein